MIQDLINPIKK